MRELIARGRSLDELWAVANGASHADKYAEYIQKHLGITVGAAGAFRGKRERCVWYWCSDYCQHWDALLCPLS